MSPKTVPVLIVGAGPTGLYLALSLLKNGTQVRIVDKETQFHVGSRGTGVQARTKELMKFFGVLPEIERLGRDSAPIRLYKLPGGTEPLSTSSIHENIEPLPSAPIVKSTAISQATHEGIIRAELEKYGCHVELGKEIRSFKQDADGVTVELVVHSLDGKPDEEETVRTEFLAGSDGAKGVVRKLLGLTFLGNTQDADGMIVGDTVITGLSEDYWHMWRDGSLTLIARALDMSQNLFNVGVVGFNFDPAEVTKAGGFPALFRRHVPRSDIVMEEPRWLSYFRPNMRMVNKLSEGRVFVLGDAAHVHSPTGGQGMNSSIQDSINLGWKLNLVLKNLAPFSLLSTYNDERLPVVTQMLQKTTGLYNQFNNTDNNPMTGPLFRDTELFMLGINYRWSPIVFDSRTPIDGMSKDELQAHAYGGYSDSLVAGDRAPEAPGLITPKKTAETSLFDLFNPTQHTVLVFTSAAKADTVSPVLDSISAYPAGTIQSVVISRRPLELSLSADYVFTDSQGHAFAGYRVGDDDLTIVVVRPDGYIGAIVKTTDEMKLYFSKIFHA